MNADAAAKELKAILSEFSEEQIKKMCRAFELAFMLGEHARIMQKLLDIVKED